MWFVHHCLTWGGSCQPQSWADLAELIAGTFLILAAWFGLLVLLLACD